MHALTIADDDKTGVAMGGDLLHKRPDRLRIVLADLLTQIWHQGYLFSLNFGPATHLLIQLAAGVKIIINAQRYKEDREKGDQRNKQLILKRELHRSRTAYSPYRHSIIFLSRDVNVKKKL